MPIIHTYSRDLHWCHFSLNCLDKWPPSWKHNYLLADQHVAHVGFRWLQNGPTTALQNRRACSVFERGHRGVFWLFFKRKAVGQKPFGRGHNYRFQSIMIKKTLAVLLQRDPLGYGLLPKVVMCIIINFSQYPFSLGTQSSVLKLAQTADLERERWLRLAFFSCWIWYRAQLGLSSPCCLHSSPSRRGLITKSPAHPPLTHPSRPHFCWGP